MAWLLLGLGCLPPRGALAQATTLRAPAERITVDDGLPQGLVWSILQDQRGAMWFATKDGLDRYDGYSHRISRHDVVNTNSLRENHVTSLFEDRDGAIWIGTDSKGLDHHDPATGRFTHIPVEGGEQVPAIFEIQQHPDGQLWVSALRARVYVLERSDEEVAVPWRMVPLQHVHPAIETKGVRSLKIASNGDVWVLGKQDVKVYRRQGREFSLYRHWPVEWQADDHTHQPMLIGNSRNDRIAMIWERRLVLYDVDACMAKDTLFLDRIQLKESKLLLDDKNRIWGLTGTGSWFRTDLRSGRTHYLDLVTSSGEPIYVRWSSSWCQDRNGVIWCGTTGYGIVKYDPRTERFHRWPIGMHGLRVAELVQADLAGEEVLNAGEFNVLNTADGTPEPTGLAAACRAAGVSAGWRRAVRGPRGDLWFCATKGSEPRHLFRFDRGTGSLEAVTHDPDDYYMDIYPGMGPEIWLSSGSPNNERDSLLTRFDTEKQRITGRFAFPGPVRGDTRRGISSWVLAPNGTVWIGCDHGLYSLDPSTGEWRHFRATEERGASLPASVVFSLCLDPDAPDAYIWVGTAGGGMAKLDMATGGSQMINDRDGLPNNVVYGILPDADGLLWVSTNAGLCRYDPGSGHTRVYAKMDGTCGSEFNRYSAVRSKDGRLFFGGMEGITWFHPEAMRDGGEPCTTVLTDLYLFNERVDVTRMPHILPKAVDHLDELVLPYDTRMLTLGFSVMDHTAPGKNRYRYRMSGLYQDWVQNGASNRATFTNLDPGRYTFQVQGCNSAGVWDHEGATLTIFITPPWWGTWWFRSLVVLAVAGLLYAFYRYRLARAMEVVHVRDRIARDLHDEIGSTLSSVALYSTVARTKAGDRVPEANAMLDRITESTTEVMEAMNDIVWAVNSKNDDMAHVVQRMRAFGVSITEAAGIRLQLDVEADVEGLALDMAQRRDLYLIFKEAVNNAVKYGQAGTVRVALTRKGGSVELKVEDDGVGFDPDDTSSRNGTGGNGLPNMQRRAREMGGELTIRSAPGAGTCILLRFDPKRRISLDPMTDNGTGSA